MKSEIKYMITDITWNTADVMPRESLRYHRQRRKDLSRHLPGSKTGYFEIFV